jgi:hypothetical protein
MRSTALRVNFAEISFASFFPVRRDTSSTARSSNAERTAFLVVDTARGSCRMRLLTRLPAQTVKLYYMDTVFAGDDEFDKIAAIVGRELAQTLLGLGGGTNRIKGKRL